MFKRPMLVAAACAAIAAHAGTNQWTPVGPAGTSAAAGIEYLARPGHAVAVTQRGIYRTTNHGATWARTFDFSNYAYYGGVATNPNPALADQVLAHGDGSGDILRSLDGGATWTRVTPAANNFNAVSAVAFSQNGAVIWAGKSDGTVYRSTNAGVDWVSLGAVASSAITQIEVDATDPLVAYLQAGLDLWRTEDQGATWSEISGPDNYSYIAASPVTSGLLMAAGFTTDFEFSRSADRGNTFTPTGVVNATGAMEFDPVDANRIYLADSNRRLHLSGDGGVTWSAGGLLPVGGAAWLSADPSAPANLLFGSNAGIAYSSDGGANWVDRHAGIHEAVFYDLVPGRAPSNYLYAVSYDSQFIYRRDPGTGSWSGIGAAADSVVQTSWRNSWPGGFAESRGGSRDLYLVRDGRVGISSDDGATWQARGTVTDARELTLDPTDPLRAYLGNLNYASSVTTDGGLTWNPIGGGLPVGMAGILVDPSSPLTLYSARDAYRTNPPTRVFKSVDGGASWSPSDTGMTGAYVWRLVMHPSRPSTLYAGMDTGLWKSTDAGASWSLMLSRSVWDIAVDPESPEIVYVSANSSPNESLRSVDGGLTWESLRAGAGSGTFDNPMHIVLVPGLPATLVQSRASGGLWELEIAPDVRLASDTTVLVMGVPATVNFTLANQGPFAATDLTFTLSLPPASSISLNSGAVSCTQDAQLARCSVPVLNSGASLPFSLGLTPSSPDEELRGIASGYESDPLVSNNVLTLATQRRANLRAQVASSTDTAQTGNAFTYAINVANLGPSVAANVVADLQLPAGTSFSALTASGLVCAHNAGMVRCTVDSLAVNASVTANVTVNAVTAGAASAMLSVTGEGTDPDATNNAISVLVTLSDPPPPPASGSSGGGGSTSSSSSSSGGGGSAGGGGGGGRLDCLLLMLLGAALVRGRGHSQQSRQSR